MANAIPIENIYFLLAYAWDRLDEADVVPVSSLSAHNLVELFARVLRSGVAHLLLRGLDRAYVPETAELAGVRGRIEIGASTRQLSFARGRAVCTFDELSVDTPANRIIKTTIRRLAAEVTLGPEDAEALRDLYRRLPGVATVPLKDSSFRRLNVSVNRSHYGFLLDLCELVHHNLLMDEQTGAHRFRDFTRDDQQMARLFEAFLRRFYHREQDEYQVSAPTMTWEAEGMPADLAYLPIMRTDLVLRRDDQVLVIDAKYYASSLTERFGKETVRSEHLYQVAAYLRHIAPKLPPSGVRGMLIYPRTTQALHLDYVILGHPFRVATVNLAQHWSAVRKELLNLLHTPRFEEVPLVPKVTGLRLAEPKGLGNRGDPPPPVVHDRAEQ